MELLRMGALWDQATQSLATVTARDLSKVKGVLNDISKTPEPVRLLMYALVSVLEGTRPEFGKDGKPLATDPLLKCREILQAADFKKRLIGVTKESETADEGTKVIKSLYASNPAFTSDKCEKAAAGSSKLFSWVAGQRPSTSPLEYRTHHLMEEMLFINHVAKFLVVSLVGPVPLICAHE